METQVEATARPPPRQNQSGDRRNATADFNENLDGVDCLCEDQVRVYLHFKARVHAHTPFVSER